jgi:hypothetical protein
MDAAIIGLQVFTVREMLPPDSCGHTPILAFKSQAAGAITPTGSNSSSGIDALAGPGAIADDKGEDSDRKKRMNKPAEHGESNEIRTCVRISCDGRS